MTDDVFVHDLISGTTVRVSVDSAGNQVRNGGEFPAISGNGRVVAFESFDSHLVPNDHNGHNDIFVHDLVTGATTRVSVDSQGREADGDSEFASISYDGRYVTFDSWAKNLTSDDTDAGRDVFVHDRLTGQTTLISGSFGTGQTSQGVTLGKPVVSGDGRYVAFDSSKALVPGDTNQAGDVFVNGPALTLDASPTHVTAGQTLTLTAYKSSPDYPTSLWITAVNLHPTMVLVAAGYFGPDGTFVVAGVVPPGLSGTAITFRDYGFASSGTATWSGDTVVCVQ
jgi:Tol biopolymer transport system component